MKKTNLLIIIMLVFYIFTNANAAEDNTSPHLDKCKGALSSNTHYPQEFKNQVIHFSLQKGMKEAEKELKVPIDLISNWIDDAIGITLIGEEMLAAEEMVEEQISLLNLSYWIVNYRDKKILPTLPNQIKTNNVMVNAAIIQNGMNTIDETVKKLHITRIDLLHWLNDRNSQLNLMYAIAQRATEGTISDWGREYRAEIDRLQFPSQHVMSVLHPKDRYMAIALALENGIEKTAQELDIPYSVLSLFVFRYKQNSEIRNENRGYPLHVKNIIIAKAIRMMAEDNISMKDSARDLNIPLATLANWLRQSHYLPSSPISND